MTRIYAPRQRQDDGRWRYTVASDDEGWCHAVGYCAGWREWTAEEIAERWGAHYVKSFLVDQERQRAFRDKYHDDGHTTADEAVACHREHELDQELRFSDADDEMRRCDAEGCREWTIGRAELGEMRRFVVCARHQNREAVAEISRR